jgi:peptide chain release factor 2
MDLSEIVINIEKLYISIKNAIKCINIEKLEKEIKIKFDLTQKPDFWNNPKIAGKISEELSSLEKKVGLWKNLLSDIETVKEIIPLLEENSDDFNEIKNEFLKIQKIFSLAEHELLLSGEFDNRNALLEITSGSGGTESQDFAEMLLRMYLRFCERKGWKAEIIERSNGIETGIKSCLLEIFGENAFGLLMAEKGTHRLVRLSPFNAKNLRQTSFAGVMVTPELEETDTENIIIPESEIRIDTFRSSGSGGQHANKTDSAVRMVHLPTNLTVVCESQRSQHQNKDKAMQILKSRIAQKMREDEEKKALELRGERSDASWGTQIRNYVLHPYKLVKDLRTGAESTNPEIILDGDLDLFHKEFLKWNVKS